MGVERLGCGTPQRNVVDRQRERILRGAAAHCGTHLRRQGDRVDRVPRAENLERIRCVTCLCQEDGTERTAPWLRASRVDRWRWWVLLLNF